MKSIAASWGIYIHYTSSGDDFATQSSSFISPRIFEEFIKPYLKERIAYTKKFTEAVFLHYSCGNVYHLIPGLIAAGVEILNPIKSVSEEMSSGTLKVCNEIKYVFTMALIHRRCSVRHSRGDQGQSGESDWHDGERRHLYICGSS